jgi:hypothetical protein
MQYITPFPGYRKTLILRQKEEELRHAIRHNCPPAKLAKAAERVRTAKLHLIKALRSGVVDRHPSDPVPKEHLANLERESEFGSSVPWTGSWSNTASRRRLDEFAEQRGWGQVYKIASDRANNGPVLSFLFALGGPC